MPSTASSCATSAFSRSDGRRDLLLSSRVLCALLALSLARGALAWGPEAHRMVGDIASRHLDPKASARIRDLLKDDRLADGQLSGRGTLGEVASWADEIREYDPKRPGRRLHFDDIPLCETPDYSRYCRNGQCASAQIDRQLKILGDESARLPQRNRALKWVVHLVGDIHQPLHAANRRDRRGFRICGAPGGRFLPAQDHRSRCARRGVLRPGGASDRGPDQEGRRPSGKGVERSAGAVTPDGGSGTDCAIPYMIGGGPP